MQGLYETQLKTHQMKASKMEAALANQTYQVLLSLAYQMLVLLTLVNKLDADPGFSIQGTEARIPENLILMAAIQVQSEKRKLEQEVIGLNERSRKQDEDNERLKSEITFLRYMMVDGVAGVDGGDGGDGGGDGVDGGDGGDGGGDGDGSDQAVRQR